MKSANSRLEIMDVEDPRVVVPIPADNIERMVVQNELSQAVLFLNDKRKLARLVVRCEYLRAPDVALGIRSALQQLSMLVPVSLRCANVAGAFNDQKSIRAFGEAVAMQDAAGDHD